MPFDALNSYYRNFIRRWCIMKKSKIITIANPKGGVGKTTTAFNLASALTEKGNKVLIVDVDPQSNLTLSFGIERPDEIKLSLQNLLMLILDGEELPNKSEYIIKGDTLDIIPCNINLSLAEINLRNEVGGENTLLELLEHLRLE